ncbi:MAG: hypothetical protein JOZ66_02130 [Hyphomicrobiales bacterium]|nr:hypothetical protein [Hyphomicrobiales bacterium]
MPVTTEEIEPLHAPRIRAENIGEALLAKFSGTWVAGDSPAIEQCIEALVENGGTGLRLGLDLAGVRELDAAGAWIIHRAVRDLRSAGHASR